MKESHAHNIQCKTDASHNKNELRILNPLQVDETLDGLKEDANTECQQENTVEEASEKLGALPTER